MKIRMSGPEPELASKGAAGFDLRAQLEESIVLHPYERTLIKTGIRIEIPEGYVGMVSPRSGLALKQGLTVLNSPGIIDSDYRGEIGVILINLGRNHAYIDHGDRIAQLVIVGTPAADIEFEQSDLSETTRGNAGFGSTGSD